MYRVAYGKPYISNKNATSLGTGRAMYRKDAMGGAKASPTGGEPPSAQTGQKVESRDWEMIAESKLIITYTYFYIGEIPLG